MNKTKTVEELIANIVDRQRDEGEVPREVAWLQKTLKQIAEAAKEEGRREGLRPANPFDSEVLCSCRPKITNI